MQKTAQLAPGKHLWAVAAGVLAALATFYALFAASPDVEAREQHLTELDGDALAMAEARARFAATVASNRFRSVTSPIVAAAGKAEDVFRPDPFAQLEKLGIDGTGLKAAAETMAVDLSTVQDFDLAGIDVSGIDTDDRKCLTQAIYYEARNQPSAGQMAVADVVLNRVSSKYYPNTICEVVFQGSTRSTGCQFSFTCDGSLNQRVEPAAMRRAQALATAILGGFHLPLSNAALNYHADYVSPYWAPTLHQTAEIGDHRFYTPRYMLRYAMADTAR